MLDISKTQIVSNVKVTESENILACLHTLLTTPKGTVVLNRDFGMDISILDEPLDIAKAQYGVEISRQVEKYEPRVRVIDTRFDREPVSGCLIPRVVIALA